MSVLAAESTPPAPSVATFDDDVWEDLLNFVEEKQVIPIVGPELVSVKTDAGPENLYVWLARSLETRLGLQGRASCASSGQGADEPRPSAELRCAHEPRRAERHAILEAVDDAGG